MGAAIGKSKIPDNWTKPFQERMNSHTTDYQLLAAGIMISILPIIVVYILFQRSFQNGIMAGAVKG